MIKKLSLVFVLSIFWLTAVQAKKHIVVNLTFQKAMAYENGELLFSGRISTGTPDRPTPTGTFRVTEKDIDHVSNSWPKPNGGAKMHYMLRLTNYGIAMHLGYVPNYPASHGCIRLENGFAQRMYYWAKVGTPVYVRGHAPKRVYRKVANRKVAKRKAVRTKIAKRKIQRTAHKVKVSNSTKKLSSKSNKQASTLDILSSSPKAAARVKRAEKENWTSRPKRKPQKVNPLDVMRG